jgi:hypothetical protein
MAAAPRCPALLVGCIAGLEPLLAPQDTSSVNVQLARDIDVVWAIAHETAAPEIVLSLVLVTRQTGVGILERDPVIDPSKPQVRPVTRRCKSSDAPAYRSQRQVTPPLSLLLSFWQKLFFSENNLFENCS